MRVAIRQFRTHDIDTLYEAVHESVDHVSEWLPWCTKEYSRQDAKEWVISSEIAWNNGADYRFVIYDQTSKKFLGSVSVTPVYHHHRIGNLGYWVRKSALGCGVATQASRLAVEYAFGRLAFNRIEIQVLPGNKASLAVVAKLGALYEGTMRNKVLHDEQPKDAMSFSLIPRDLQP